MRLQRSQLSEHTPDPETPGRKRLSCINWINQALKVLTLAELMATSRVAQQDVERPPLVSTGDGVDLLTEDGL